MRRSRHLSRLVLRLTATLCLLALVVTRAAGQDVEIVRKAAAALRAVLGAEKVAEAPAPDTNTPATKPGNKGVTPAEYAGPAMPREHTGAVSQIERARELAAEKEWTKALDILDGLLAGKGVSDGDESSAAPEPETDESGERIPAGALPRAAARAAADGEEGEASDEADTAPPPPLVFTEDGVHYVPLADAVARTLRTLPAEAREVYRKTYEPPARQALEEASALPYDESLDALEALSRRFPLTAAGDAALELLADRALDLGASARAADAYVRLLESRLAPRASGDDGGATDNANDDSNDDEVTPNALPVIAKATFASLLAGRRTSALALLERARTELPDAIATIGGEPVSGADLAAVPFLEALLARRTERGAATWTCAMARPDHTALDLGDIAPPPLGSRSRWIHSFAEGYTSAESAGSISLKPGQPLRLEQFYEAFPATQAVAVGDRVLTRSRGELVALDTSSGKLVWRTNLGAVGASTGDVSPSPEQAYAAFQYLGGSSITVVGDIAIIIDAQSQAVFDNKGRLSYVANTLLALDVRSGKLRWRVGGAEGYPESLRTYCFTAPPTPAGGDLLVAPATRGDGPSLVGLTTSGKLRWIERLYNYNTGYLQRNRNAVSQGASLAIADGLAISAPGHGVVAAVDVQSGRMRWTTRYRMLPSASTARARGDQTIWAPGHPIVSGRHVVVAPYDSAHLIALDAASGATLWERGYEADHYQLVGVADDTVFVVGPALEALDLATGEPRWTSAPLERAAGRGFVTTTRVYVPLENAIAVLDTADGKLIEQLGFADGRLQGLQPANLVLAPWLGAAEDSAPSTRLLATGAWGVALVQPQDEAWVEVEERGGRESFDRARLLRAERRYAEAIALGDQLLAGARRASTIAAARALLVETSRDAARDESDPSYIERLLARPGLELEDGIRVALRLEMARLLEKDAPERAATIYREIRAELGGASDLLAFTPDGVLAAPARASADALARLIEAGRIAPSESARGEVRSRLAALPADPRDARRTLLDIALEAPQLPEAAEACARLAALAAADGDLAAATRWLERLEGAYPRLGGNEAIAARRAAYERALTPRETLAAELEPLLADEAIEWKQEFWKQIDQGFLVETRPGSQPLREVLALRAGKLHVFSVLGASLGSVALEDFPDVEQAKAGLQSHVEEPGEMISRGDDGVLFTAAGVYHLELPRNPFLSAVPAAADAKPEADPSADSATAVEALRDALEPAVEADASDGASDAADGEEADGTGEAADDDAGSKSGEKAALPAPGWWQSYKHAIDTLHGQRNVLGWGRATLSRLSGNLFPAFETVDDDATALVLQPDGELLGIDLHSGKVRFRHADVSRVPIGAPVLRGRGLVVNTVKPAGVAVYRTTSGGGALHEAIEIEGATLHDAVFVEGVAVVLDSSRGIEVRDAAGRNVLWREDASRSAPTLARATGADVWIVHPEGRLECRSLLGGQLRWTAPAPRDAMAVRAFDVPDAAATSGSSEGAEARERSVWLLLATDGTRPGDRGYAAFTQTGTALHLVQLTESGRVLRTIEIGGHGVTSFGQRWIVGPGRWLFAYNEAREDGRWFTRLASFDPATGALREHLEAPIAGKGTGLPPRLAVVVAAEDGALGLAIGNAEGFGVYRARAKPVKEAPAADEEPKSDEARPAAPAEAPAPATPEGAAGESRAPASSRESSGETDE